MDMDGDLASFILESHTKASTSDAAAAGEGSASTPPTSAPAPAGGSFLPPSPRPLPPLDSSFLDTTFIAPKGPSDGDAAAGDALCAAIRERCSAQDEADIEVPLEMSGHMVPTIGNFVHGILFFPLCRVRLQCCSRRLLRGIAISLAVAL